MLVTLMAYAGLRPEEALGLTWPAVRQRTLLIDRAVTLGEEKGTKTAAHRTVDLLAAVRDDLEEYRPAALSGPRLFARADGEPWRDTDWRNWRRRHFRAAATAAGQQGARPYDLRHSFASLLIRAGHDVIYVATQAGHSPEMCLRTYAHELAEARVERVDASEAIAAARAATEQAAP